MSNPNHANGQGFFVPDLLGTLPNTIAAIIDQRVNTAVEQRFNHIEQRLGAIENVLRLEGRLQPLNNNQNQQQLQQQQHHNQHNQNAAENDPVMALAAHNAAQQQAVGPPANLIPPQQQQQQALPTPPAVLHAMANVIPMEIPPEGYPISSRATMQLELDQFTVPRGYSMRMSGTRDMGKGKRKIRWICFRAGEARYSEASKAAGQPERASKKCGCPFKFECVETLRDSNVWVVHHHITPGTTTHNHAAADPSEDPRSRKLPPPVAAEVDAWLRAGWQVSKIMAELKTRGFKNVLSRDLYNRKQQLKREDESAEA